MQDTDFVVIPQGAYVDAEQVGHFSDCEKVFHDIPPLVIKNNLRCIGGCLRGAVYHVFSCVSTVLFG